MACTCWDFTTGDEAPFALLKLDMARQCWDEARHVEISVKLAAWMGSEIGQYAENTVLFEAACSRDPVLRLAGVNRALKMLAIDVFTTMPRVRRARPGSLTSSSVTRTGCSPTRSPT